MFSNIYRKLKPERRIILQKFLIGNSTCTTIVNTDIHLLNCRYASIISKLTGKQNDFVSSLSKNILRYSTNLATENKIPLTVNTLSLSPLQSEISDDEVKKLLTLDWTTLSLEEFVSTFKKFSCYISNLDQSPEINYDNFLQALSAMTPNFSDEEISHMLQYLTLWFKNKNHPKHVRNYTIQTLDKECFNRFSKQTLESMIMFSQLFANLRYGKDSAFVRKSLLKLGQKAKHLSPSQLAQFMILMSVFKNLPVNLYNIEYYVEKNMESFSLLELSKISVGFYINKTEIKSGKLLKHILERMLNNMEDMNTHMVSAFSKLLCNSYKPMHELDDLFWKVLKALEPHLPRFNLPTVTSIAYLSAYILIYEKGLMTSIFERYDQEITNASIKNIEKITYSLSHLNYDSKYPLFKKIVEEISKPERQQEIEEHRRSLSHILKYLAIVNIYPIKVLEKVMDPEYLNKVYSSKYAMKGEYFFLDLSIAAELPNYTGPRLSDDLRKFLAKKHKAIANSEMRNREQSKTLKEVVATCQRILKTESGVFTDKLLPQFYYQDVIICLDEQNNPISPESFLSNMRFDTVKPVPEEAKRYKWIVLILTTRNFVFKNSHEIGGILASKIRQLKSLGYTPIVISHYKWVNINSQEDCEQLQEDYIKSLLNIE